MHFSQSINTRVSTSVSRGLQMHCSTGESSSALCECRVKGGMLFTRLNVDGGVLSNFPAHSVALSCASPNCFTAGGLLNMNHLANTSMSALSSFHCSVMCAGASCKARGVLISIDGQMKRSAVSEATSSNSAASCDGAGCYCLGGEFSAASVGASSDMCADAGSTFSSIESSAAYAACRGNNCFVLGGTAYVETVFCLVIHNVTAHNSKLPSDRTNSKAAGGVLGVAASNRSDFRDIRSLQSSVLSRGNSSQALEALCLYCLEMCQFVIAFFPNRQCGASDTNVPQQEVLYPLSALSNTSQTSTRALIFPPRFLARVASCAPV